MPLSNHQVKSISRGRGCLLGLAAGDALGGPLEGLTAQQIAAGYRVVEDYVDGTLTWRKKPFRWRLKGLYTDDTQQALAVADTLLAKGKLDSGYLADLYLELAAPKGSYMGSHRAVGKSFRKVLAELQRGVPAESSGQLSAGIGATMRVAPIALYYADDPDAMFRAVMSAGLMTHRDIRSLAGALGVAFALRRIFLGAERNPSFLFRVASDLAAAEKRVAHEYGRIVLSLDQHLHAMSRAIAKTESLLELGRETALPAVIEEANRCGAEPPCKSATKGFPPACIPACLLIFMTAETFEEAVIDIVNLGGDADSNGAIVGALAGAHFTESEIPARWIENLKNAEGIAARGAAVAGGPIDRSAIPDFLTVERKLSEQEAQYRDEILWRVQSGKGGDLGANRRI